MNIEKYYQLKANISLNGSMVALLPVIVLVFCGPFIIPKTLLIVYAFPFIVYSFWAYQMHLFYKSEDTLEVEKGISSARLTKKLDDLDSFGLAFLPAPSLKLPIYANDGQLLATLQDEKANRVRWFLPRLVDQYMATKYHLTDQQGNVLVQYSKKGSKNWEIHLIETGKIGVVRRLRNNGFSINLSDTNMELSYSSSQLFIDVQWFNRNGQCPMRIRKGWLPSRFDNHFKDPNTPILQFDHHLNLEERYMLLTLVIIMFRYFDH